MEPQDVQQDLAQIHKALDAIASATTPPFWQRFDFWFFTAIGLFGLFFSVRAFMEAQAAKRAATAAGKTVKVQTVAIELSEVAQKIDAIEPTITFSDARNLLAEISRKLRRVISPFAEDADLVSAIEALRTALTSAQDSLKSVRPSGTEDATASTAVYYGIENDFANINNLVADLIGLLEKRTIGLETTDGRA
jgi:hypothetical protein